MCRQAEVHPGKHSQPICSFFICFASVVVCGSACTVPGDRRKVVPSVTMGSPFIFALEIAIIAQPSHRRLQGVVSVDVPR